LISFHDFRLAGTITLAGTIARPVAGEEERRIPTPTQAQTAPLFIQGLDPRTERKGIGA